MQSLSRMLRRNRAMFVMDNVTKGIETVVKRGTPKTQWGHAKKNRMLASEQEYQDGITKPLKHADIEKSKNRYIYKNNPKKKK